MDLQLTDKVVIVTHYHEKYPGRKPYLTTAREQDWSDDGIQPPGEVDTNIQKAEFRQPGE